MSSGHGRERRRLDRRSAAENGGQQQQQAAKHPGPTPGTDGEHRRAGRRWSRGTTVRQNQDHTAHSRCSPRARRTAVTPVTRQVGTRHLGSQDRRADHRPMPIPPRRTRGGVRPAPPKAAGATVRPDSRRRDTTCTERQHERRPRRTQGRGWGQAHPPPDARPRRARPPSTVTTVTRRNLRDPVSGVPTRCAPRDQGTLSRWYPDYRWGRRPGIVTSVICASGPAVHGRPHGLGHGFRTARLLPPARTAHPRAPRRPVACRCRCVPGTSVVTRTPRGSSLRPQRVGVGALRRTCLAAYGPPSGAHGQPLTRSIDEDRPWPLAARKAGSPTSLVTRPRPRG